MDSAGNEHGFVFDGTTYTEINDPLGLNSTVINGINDKGQIVGFFTDENGNVDGFVGTPSATAPTPEPSSLILLAAGLIGLCGYARKRLVSSAPN